MHRRKSRSPAASRSLAALLTEQGEQDVTFETLPLCSLNSPVSVGLLAGTLFGFCRAALWSKAAVSTSGWTDMNCGMSIYCPGENWLLSDFNEPSI